jgi:long-subunit fatty acid transport protein
MNTRRTLLFLLTILPTFLCAEVAIIEKDTSIVTPEAHIFATFVKSFDHGLSITLEEEIRSAPTHRAHTTVGLTYAPIQYVNIYAAYTLKLYGNQGWTDPNKYLQHRANFLVTGQIKLGQWNLSLREGVMLDGRTGKVDKRIKNQVDFTLRSRLQAVYSIPETPLSIVGKFEILNTLNAIDQVWCPLVEGSLENIMGYDVDLGGQYISELRPEAGVQWKINKHNSLTLTYRYNYLYDRGISIDDITENITITNKYTTKHLILLAYKFGW